MLFALARVAVSPLDRIGWLPVSRTVIVLRDWSFRVFSIGVILRNPKHFCMYSVVTILFAGSVELTRSVGGMRGVGLVRDWSKIDVRGGRSFATRTTSSRLSVDDTDTSSSSR